MKAKVRRLRNDADDFGCRGSFAKRSLIFFSFFKVEYK